MSGSEVGQVGLSVGTPPTHSVEHHRASSTRRLQEELRERGEKRRQAALRIVMLDHAAV